MTAEALERFVSVPPAAPVTTLDRAELAARLGGVGEVLRLAVPATAQLALAMLVFVAERALVARGSPTALASLHAATAVTFATLSVGSAIGRGTLAVVGRRLGAGDLAGARSAARWALAAAAATGVAVSIALAAAGEAPLRALFPRAGADVLADAAPPTPSGAPAAPHRRLVYGPRRGRRTPRREPSTPRREPSTPRREPSTPRRGRPASRTQLSPRQPAQRARRPRPRPS